MTEPSRQFAVGNGQEKNLDEVGGAGLLPPADCELPPLHSNRSYSSATGSSPGSAQRQVSKT